MERDSDRYERLFFLDTNVLLDMVSHRSGESTARTIVESYLGPTDRVCVSYLSLANLCYILRKEFSVGDLRNILGEICSKMKVVAGSDQHYYDLQILCAEYEKCDVILTRNVKDFRNNTLIPVLSPEDFFSHLG